HGSHPEAGGSSGRSPEGVVGQRGPSFNTSGTPPPPPGAGKCTRGGEPDQANLPPAGATRLRALLRGVALLGLPLLPRRAMLCSAGLGFGAWACSTCWRPAATVGPAPRAAQPRRVIFLFVQGGPSPLDTFDYEPLLEEAGRSRTG